MPWLTSCSGDTILPPPRAGRPCLRLSNTKKNLGLPSDTDCHSPKCKKDPPRASSILCRSEDPAPASRLWQRARRTVPPKPADRSTAPATDRPIAPGIQDAAEPIPERTGPGIAQWHLWCGVLASCSRSKCGLSGGFR